MISAKLVWAPWPYRAGFGITDDTDAATMEQVKAVYDHLLAKKIRTTKTVWAFEPAEKCGIPATPDSTLRGVTLQDTEYLAYCKMLAENNYEICLHGASAGNNKRVATLKAFELLQREIGVSDTFICHSKNADNIYWNHKITSLFPFRQLLQRMNKFECSGEIEGSPWFWGDLCSRKVNNIRLLRTRDTNTLKRNPSMPYYSPEKPFVNGWFSATKRSLADCTSPAALNRLVNENGMTILYQYLHRYADPQTLKLNKKFTDAIDTLAANKLILVDTVSNLLKRLRLIQGVFIVHRENTMWILNTNNEPVPKLQLALSANTALTSEDCEVNVNENHLVIRELPRHGIAKLNSSEPIDVAGPRCYYKKKSDNLFFKLPAGSIAINLSKHSWNLSNGTILEPGTFLLNAKESGTGNPILSLIPRGEEFSLLMGQIWIVAREILFKGRSMNSDKFLDSSKEIKLENHENW